MLVGNLASGIKKLGIEGKPLKTQDGAVLPKVVTMVWLVIGTVCICRMALAGASSEGNSAFSDAVNFFNLKVYDKASEAYWSAVMRFSTGATYTVEAAFMGLMKSYSARGMVDEGYVFVGDQYTRRQQISEGLEYYKKALEINSSNLMANINMAQYMDSGDETGKRVKYEYLRTALDIDPNNSMVNHLMGHFHFDKKNWLKSIQFLDRAYNLDNRALEAATSAIYIRFTICHWGRNGSQYRDDLKFLSGAAKKEWESVQSGSVAPETSNIHPHMSLGYALDPFHKLAIATNYANREMRMVLHSGMVPFDDTSASSRKRYLKQSKKKAFRIKVGYVSANIKSKTTVYMAQDLMRFHDRSKFEIHVFATSPPDNDLFLKISMRGVDWREKMKNGAEFFHDTSSMDANATSHFIRNLGIHILLNWDGYSNEGLRATGLFPMHSAPIQVAHQEYIGTMGADYIQYLITDKIASPPEFENHYSEKFIYMPNSFLANSFAYQQPDMDGPLITLPQNDNPSVNKCRLDVNNDYDDDDSDGPSFVFCNFNKHLKFDPDLFAHWLDTIASVKNSYLCLLENPSESRQFITEFAEEHREGISHRIRYLPFISNPYDNQRRSVRYCSAVLDTTVYNGHTTAADALWGGVPVVTRGDGSDMGSRVGASVLTALGLPDLIAYTQEEYNSIALKLASDKLLYSEIRKRLLTANLVTSPRNPFWDLERYVRNLESGFTAIWSDYTHGRDAQHVDIIDSGFNSLGIKEIDGGHDDTRVKTSAKSRLKKSPKSKKNETKAKPEQESNQDVLNEEEKSQEAQPEKKGKKTRRLKKKSDKSSRKKRFTEEL